MTDTDRIFLRRHYATFLQLADKTTARRATIRQACSFGMRGTEVARFFRVSAATVYQAIGSRSSATQKLAAARRDIHRLEKSLRMAQGRERTAIERLGRLLPSTEMKWRRDAQ